MRIVLPLFLVTLFALVGCSDEEARLQKLDAKLNRGEYDSVIEEMQDFLKDHPKSAKGHVLLGWAYAKTDQLEKGEQHFDKALALDPKWDNAYVGKGVIARTRGDLGAARNCYLKAIDLVPENAEAFSSLLVIEVLERNDKKAVEYGEKAWGLRKDLATIPANLAIAYHYTGQVEKRDEMYGHAERLGYHQLDTLRSIFAGDVSLR